MPGREPPIRMAPCAGRPSDTNYLRFPTTSSHSAKASASGLQTHFHQPRSDPSFEAVTSSRPDSCPVWLRKQIIAPKSEDAQAWAIRWPQPATTGG